MPHWLKTKFFNCEIGKRSPRKIFRHAWLRRHAADGHTTQHSYQVVILQQVTWADTEDFLHLDPDKQLTLILHNTTTALSLSIEVFFSIASHSNNCCRHLDSSYILVSIILVKPFLCVDCCFEGL